MSAEYNNVDPITLAKQAEADLNSHAAKHGTSNSDSTDSGIDESNITKFPGASVSYGTGQGDNREIPESEGGGLNSATGQPLKARDFEGEGGPEEKAARREQEAGGDEDILSNVRPGGETRRP